MFASLNTWILAIWTLLSIFNEPCHSHSKYIMFYDYRQHNGVGKGILGGSITLPVPKIGRRLPVVQNHYMGTTALADPEDACQPIPPHPYAPRIHVHPNWIVLVKNGNCDILEKVINAQKAQYEVILIYEDEDKQDPKPNIALIYEDERIDGKLPVNNMALVYDGEPKKPEKNVSTVPKRNESVAEKYKNETISIYVVMIPGQAGKEIKNFYLYDKHIVTEISDQFEKDVVCTESNQNKTENSTKKCVKLIVDDIS